MPPRDVWSGPLTTPVGIATGAMVAVCAAATSLIVAGCVPPAADGGT